MAPSDKDSPTSVADSKEKESKSKVAEYLQAPRKKRKSYVIIALGRGVREELSHGVEAYLRAQFKGVALYVPRTEDDLSKAFNRQIVLMIFDDEFVDFDTGMGMMLDLKGRKNAQAVPVLFFTRQPTRLIAQYNQRMAPFHETDDYIVHPKADLSFVLSKIRNGLINQNRRRSRRYKTDITIKFFLLTTDKYHPGRIMDMSIHGALLKADDGQIFRPGDQLKIYLPITTFLLPEEGEYLRLSAKVRRVYIGGSQVAISFEYLSDQQLKTLTKFLLELVGDQMTRRGVGMKAKQGAAGR